MRFECAERECVVGATNRHAAADVRDIGNEGRRAELIVKHGILSRSGADAL
jgi:hypothetical protein